MTRRRRDRAPDVLPGWALARCRVRDDRAEPAAVEDQWLACVELDPVHSADDDVVVAARVPVLEAALDMRDAAVKQGCAEDAHAPVEPGELVVRGASEPLGDLLLVRGEHVD